jgi:hypothetical protein
VSNANTKHEPNFTRKGAVKKYMSHSFRNSAYRTNIKRGMLVSNGEPVQQELPFKALNFRRNRSFPEFIKHFMPIRGGKGTVPNAIKVVGNGGIMIKKFVNIFSLGSREESTILPPKGEKTVRIHISSTGEIKVRASHSDKIISSLMRGREIKLIGEDFPTDKLIMLKYIHDILNTFVGPQFGRATFSQGKGLTLV